MNRSILVFVAVLLAVATSSASAQVVPSATGRQFSLTAGGLASAFQPEYAGGFVPSESPNRLYGVGGFVDVQFTRWFQLEAEGRWLRFNEFVNIDQDTYLVGPRLPIRRLRLWRATPYVKALAGRGYMNYEFNEGSGNYTTLAYGGGLDVNLGKRFSARGDFEYQQWLDWPQIPGVSNTMLYPYGVSFGLGYRILGGRP
jgi:opacity protein-like surface antigen